jgi:lipoate---protein ligase
LNGAVRAGGWRVERRAGRAAELHAAWPSVDGHPGGRAVALCQPQGSALVLGSTQPDTIVDGGRTATAGVEVVRRRSGGGAVLVRPGDPLWVDVWVPRDDPLADVDVGRAFMWLGRAWAAALGSMGVDGLSVAPGPVGEGDTTAVACFGAVSTGEVTTADGRKIVGLAQRRVRAGSWFHGACLIGWEPRALVALLSLDPADAEDLIVGLEWAAVGLADVVGDRDGALASRAADAFVAALP